jgi:hypothetical protein
MNALPCSSPRAVGAGAHVCARRQRAAGTRASAAFVDATGPRRATDVEGVTRRLPLSARDAGLEYGDGGGDDGNQGDDSSYDYVRLVAPAAATLGATPSGTQHQQSRRRRSNQQQQRQTPQLASFSLDDWAVALDERRAEDERDGDRRGERTPAGQSSAAPRRDTVFQDGGNIPLQDKFGLLLSLCSVLVSVQWFIPRVL